MRWAVAVLLGLLLTSSTVACRDPLVVQPDAVGGDVPARDEGTPPDDIAQPPDAPGPDAPGLDARGPDADAATPPPDAPRSDVPLVIDVPLGDGGLSPDPPPERRVTCGPRAGTPSVTAGAADRYVLRGRIVSPATVIPRGEVLITGGTIACVAASCAGRTGYAGATVVETAGLIYPGLIDGHNHVHHDFLPPWPPPRLFGNRYQWARTSEYDAFIAPYRENSGNAERFCAMGRYGEVRAMVAGTTTIQGADDRTCMRPWGVRNVEYRHDFNGVDTHRTNVLGISTVMGTSLTALQTQMRDGTVTAYIVHLAEGVDMSSSAEFDELETKMLLTPATVMVHGTALTTAQHGRAGMAGAKLVWSPRSNVILYGATTNIPAALAAGMTVALAPDWTPSGGPNLLSEMRYAREVSRRVFLGRLTSRDIVEMATSRAAQVMDRANFIGTLEEGRFADVMVIPDTGCDPYDSLIDAVTADVALVFINGLPRYGDRALMAAMPATRLTSCEDLSYCGVAKRGCIAEGPRVSGDGGQTLAEITATISAFYPTPYPLVPLCPP